MSNSDQQLEHATEMDYLAELTEEMIQVKRQALLNVLKERKYVGRRKHARKSCFVAVDYAVGDRAFKDFITNISLGGLFVETHKGFPVKQEIVMSFSSAKFERPVKAIGQIVRSVPQGIGVAFETANQNLEPMMKSLS